MIFCIVPVMPTQTEISEILRAELERATRQHEEAKRKFWRVSADIRSEQSQPDGTRRVQNAAIEQNGAMKALAATLRRMNEFLMDGTVPEDLRDK
jgi:outer membrane PBP1 activator LpoA protein